MTAFLFDGKCRSSLYQIKKTYKIPLGTRLGVFVQISKDLIAFEISNNINFPGNLKSCLRRKKCECLAELAAMEQRLYNGNWRCLALPETTLLEEWFVQKCFVFLRWNKMWRLFFETCLERSYRKIFFSLPCVIFSVSSFSNKALLSFVNFDILNGQVAECLRNGT